MREARERVEGWRVAAVSEDMRRRVTAASGVSTVAQRGWPGKAWAADSMDVEARLRGAIHTVVGTGCKAEVLFLRDVEEVSVRPAG